MTAPLRDQHSEASPERGSQGPSAAAPGPPSTAPRGIPGPAVAPASDAPIDSDKWTGEVEAQEREGRTFIILLLLAVAVGTPFAVWISLALSRFLFS